jgi:hypothetical protein
MPDRSAPITPQEAELRMRESDWDLRILRFLAEAAKRKLDIDPRPAGLRLAGNL